MRRFRADDGEGRVGEDARRQIVEFAMQHLIGAESGEVFHGAVRVRDGAVALDDEDHLAGLLDGGGEAAQLGFGSLGGGDVVDDAGGAAWLGGIVVEKAPKLPIQRTSPLGCTTRNSSRRRVSWG